MTNTVLSLLQQPKAIIMGVVNVTPDSFSDGGRYVGEQDAIKHIELLISQGADIIDIGGESTRPGADRVAEQVELDRVIPVIEKIQKNFDVPISIDTSKPTVMAAAVNAGVAMINDVNALQQQGAEAVAAESAIPVCLMHKQGEPKNMQHQPTYQNVVVDVVEFLKQRIDACLQSGISKQHIIVDPGIGFGKILEHNLALLAATPQLVQQLDTPVLIGVSRKSFIDHLLGREVEQRLAGSVGLAVHAVLSGAKIVRVHDVAETVDAVRCVEAVVHAS